MNLADANVLARPEDPPAPERNIPTLLLREIILMLRSIILDSRLQLLLLQPLELRQPRLLRPHPIPLHPLVMLPTQQLDLDQVYLLLVYPLRVLHRHQLRLPYLHLLLPIHPVAHQQHPNLRLGLGDLGVKLAQRHPQPLSLFPQHVRLQRAATAVDTAPDDVEPRTRSRTIHHAPDTQRRHPTLQRFHLPQQHVHRLLHPHRVLP